MSTMWLVLLCCLTALPPLTTTTAEEEVPGVCIVPYVVEKHRYVIDRRKNAWKYEKFNETLQQEQCCSGYQVVNRKPLSCAPVCDPPCINSDCEAPDVCVCRPGQVMINNSSATCIDVCDACVHGACLWEYDVECTCFAGYKRDPSVPHICDPVCHPACVNASCSAPMTCECHQGYKPHPDTINNKHVCVPHCTEDCIFGTCTDPDVCTCAEGYINDEDAPSICLPVCNTTCVNGYCYAPDMCKCRDGFDLHPRDPYRCVSWVPEHSSLNYCVLSMPQAIKYDKDSDCFLLKDKITLNVTPDCRVLESQSGSFCSQIDNCHHVECVLNFRCSMKIINGSNEIHCNLEHDDFETDSTDANRVTNTSEWTDVVLVVNSFQHFNSSGEIKQNITKQWTLQPLSKGPICGKMQFAVEMSECEISDNGSQANTHINSSFMFWMNVILICGFLLMVGAGVGGFLWARHRRLNDPLNYRGNMSQGYINDCYDNHPELESDDNSDHYSDAPL